MLQDAKQFETSQTFRLADGTELSFREQRPTASTSAVRGHILLVHGLGEHCGRYRDVANYFASHGFHFLAYDQRGHGKSPGRRGDAESIELLISDLHEAIREIVPSEPPIPLFLYGHSFGGMIVLKTLAQPKTPQQLPGIRGAIVTSPLVQPTKPPGIILQKTGELLAKLWPSFVFRTRFNGELLTQDAAKLQAYKEDHLCHGSVTARLAVKMLAAGESLLDEAAAITYPIQLHHGATDPITSCSASEEFARRAGEIVEMNVWDAQRHELHQETRRDEFLASVIRWLDEKLK